MNFKLFITLNVIALIACDQIVVNHSLDGDQISKRVQRKGKKHQRKDVKTKKKERWVVDSIFYDDYQSDGPSPTKPYDFCPPVPEVIDEDACTNDTCKSDLDCNESYRCCFNGCTYSCLFEVEPAPVVDWLKEPRRSRSGIAWLLPKKKPSPEEVETCTTGPFEPDEDPLLCPHGYFCYVDTRRKRNKKKKSNTGYCVKQTDDQYSPGETEMALTASLKGRKICHVDGMVLLDGASIQLSDKKCKCKGGYLSCKPHQVRSKRIDVTVQPKNLDKSKKMKNKDRKQKERIRNKSERISRI